MNKEEVLEKYFHNAIKSKSLRYFEETTPKGNLVRGWICLEPGYFLSSIFLEEAVVNGEIIPQNRFLRGMPKQHYYDKNKWALNQNEDFTLYHCYEKLDGTCLMLYTLYDSEDRLLEIVPRTRGLAVAGQHIIEMYNMIDHAQIESFYSFPHNYDYVLMFELYGILNQHEISYFKTYIDLSFIGATFNENVLKMNDTLKIAYDCHFQMPYRLFSLYAYKNKWRIWGETSPFFPYYIDPNIAEETFDSLEECINRLSEIMETINCNYKKKNGYYALEGVVINGIDSNQNQRYVKIKPHTIYEKAKLSNGIPNSAIRKEVYRYFDENSLNKVEYLYKIDPLHYLKTIRKSLEQDFPSEYVCTPETNNKITKLFFKIWEAKIPSKSVQAAVSELLQKYPDENIINIMRFFSEEYPFLKGHSRQVYSILSQITGDK